MRLIVFALSAASALLAQAPDMKTASSYALSVQAQLRRNIERSAEKMPEESFGFRPSPDIRTFAELMGHIANAEYLFCSAALGEANPNTVNLEKEKKTKADVVAAVKGAFAYCEKAYANMSDDRIGEMAKMGNGERNKLGVLFYNNTHTNEHYGNLVTYMRIRGIVPPSSER